jgi:hypothetical protein
VNWKLKSLKMEKTSILKGEFLPMICVCVVLEIKYRALYMLDKPSTTELQPQPNDLSECLERIRNCVLSF